MKSRSLQSRLLVAIVLSCVFSSDTFSQQVTWNNQVFRVDTLAENLSYPWEITYGPDDSIWVTEARSYKVRKIHPRNKGNRVIANLINDKNFTQTSGQIWPQGGMMGLAIHPNFNGGDRYVYVAYVYRRNGTCNNGTGSPCNFNTKIVRFLYPDTGSRRYTLCYGDTLISSLTGSNDHNSGRMTIGPDNLLYYSIGDMGAGQFNNASRTNNAQVLTSNEGKILRFNLKPDASQTGEARWIPDTNPYPGSGPVTSKTPVYSFGHRNPQGLVWGTVNAVSRLYSSEHGDKSDDEVNIINSTANYGWPKVAGLGDNNYNSFDGFANNNILAGQTIGREDTFCTNQGTTAPMFSLFNATAASINGLGGDIFTWPTIAPSSIDFYKDGYSNAIPGWRNSILVPSLKHGLFRLKLKMTNGAQVDSNSTASITDTIPYFHGNRIRDIAINPHGDTLYIAIDSSGNTSGPTGGFGSGSATSTVNAGRILRIVYLTTLAIRDYIPERPVNNRTYVKVYPNPASKTLYVQSKRGMHKPLRVEFWDMSGKLSMNLTTTRDNFAIGLEGLSRGVYIFKMYNGFGVLMTTEKIIIQ
ncbi:MAG: PQQ-dependent sugar dehydrogenase [Chitinophagaceae bacterium]|nr:PQQ-dependent sugar dehydrogenase [Chitinophagaceae bacterium]